MAGDAPTPGELERTFERLRHDVRDDIAELQLAMRDNFAGLNSRLDKVLSLDVYAADRRAIEERINGNRTDLEKLGKTVEKNRSDTETARAADLKAAKEDRDRRAADRRWLIGAFVIPAVILILQLYFASRGLK